MKLFLKGHNHRYELEQILISLFPDKRPLISETLPKDGDFAVCSLSSGRIFVTARTFISLGGKAHAKSLRIKITPLDELERIRRDRHLLKRTFYLAACPFIENTPPWGSLTGIRPAKLAASLLLETDAKSAKHRLINDYYVSEAKTQLLLDCARYGLAYKNTRSEDDVSIYIGIPFCPTRCAYCSFISSAAEKNAHLIPPYLSMLSEEISSVGKTIQKLGLNIKSVYIGGGTPTTLSALQLYELIKQIGTAFDIKNAEFTVEAGRPDTIDPDKLRVLKDGGVTRISINPQSMSDAVLKTIGRSHTADDIKSAMSLTEKFGFRDINMDLIAGLPGSGEADFLDSVNTCIGMNPTNITIHTLSYKKGSDLSGKFPADMKSGLHAALSAAYVNLHKAGFEPYYLYRQKFMTGGLENTGWCRKNHEGQYNIYIMEELHTIISLGAGGVTKLVNQKRNHIGRLFNKKYPGEYIRDRDKILSDKEKIIEYYANTRLED